MQFYDRLCPTRKHVPREEILNKGLFLGKLHGPSVLCAEFYFLLLRVGVVHHNHGEYV